MTRQTVPRRGAGDRGVTLPELLICIAILGVIGAALGTAFIVTARNSTDIAQRFSESHDAQIASAFLATDVQSTSALTLTTCGSAGTLSPVLNFGFDGGSIASYLYGPAGGETRLIRRLCDAGGSAVSEVVLVHNGGGTPTTTCDGTTCNPAATPRPSKVKITVPEHNRITGVNDYTYSLTGSRRAYVNGGGATPPGVTGYPTLLALGTTGNQLAISGNGSLVVNGGIIVNSNSSGAMSRSGTNSSVTASGGVQVVQPGTCGGCTGFVPVTGRTNPVLDPLAGLPLPEENGVPVFTDGKPTHGPGVYRTAALQFPNGVTTLAPGVYIVESGFTFSAQAVINGNGVMLFNGCGLHAPVSCTNTGKFNLGGQVPVTLSPPTTGTYSGMTLWQPAANTQPVSITGQSGAISITGLIYAPGASSITLGAGNGGLTIGAVVGPHVTVSGNGIVTVG